jgi:hypothetical protein
LNIKKKSFKGGKGGVGLHGGAGGGGVGGVARQEFSVGGYMDNKMGYAAQPMPPMHTIPSLYAPSTLNGYGTAAAAPGKSQRTFLEVRVVRRK